MFKTVKGGSNYRVILFTESIAMGIRVSVDSASANAVFPFGSNSPTVDLSTYLQVKVTVGGNCRLKVLKISGVGSY